jgi:hypothetical protein
MSSNYKKNKDNKKSEKKWIKKDAILIITKKIEMIN